MGCVSHNIKDLTLNSRSFFINALVIAKTETKIFNTWSNNTGVITLTVRDTRNHCINCSIWGDGKFIENCSRAYKIGDVISIYNPTVRQNSNSAYYPRTLSPFELKVYESRACIHRVSEDSEDLLQLQNQAVKPTNLALKLNDLNCSNGSDPLSVDLVVLVRAVGPIFEVQTKLGPKNVRRVYLMDTTMESISMTVWHAEYQERMDGWKLLETVLHLVDVQATYSDFERSTVLTVTHKTIIVENPVRSSRSNDILAHIHSLSLNKIAELKSIQVNRSICADSITEVMTVKHILDEIEQGGFKQIAAIVYAVITKFPISSATVRSCANCKQMLFNRTECESVSCVDMDFNGPKFIEKFYMNVSLTDHSGTLNCRITDTYGKQIFGRSAQELKATQEDDLNKIDQRYNLERFAIKVVVRPTSNKKHSAEIVSIESHHPDAMEKALKI